MRALLFFALTISTLSFAVERPGGLNHTAVGEKAGTYEVLLSPALTLSPSGAYLSSEFRYQASEDLSIAGGFGSGEVGFNLGGNVIWYVAPDLESQPAFAVLGGLYFNRFDNNNYFVVKVTPIVSKEFRTGWGSVSPYAGMHVTPSFRLNEASNQIALKTSTGLQFKVKELGGLQLWSEFGVGLVNANHEVVVGLSYPFADI